MPTAAKIVAALALAIVMYVATVNYIPNLPEGTQVHRIREIAAGIGFVCGWWIIGPQPGLTFMESLSNGLKGALVATFWTLMAAASYTMLQRSMRMMYDGVMEAVLGVFQQLVDFGALALAPGVVGVVVIGGMMAGAVARGTARRWS